MSEIKRLLFKKTEDEKSQFIDIMAALTAVNRKQYHQCRRDGTPMAVHFTIRSYGEVNTTSINAFVLGNNWTTRNAASMAAKGWKQQLKHADVRISDLPTYGKNCRFAMRPASTIDITMSGTGSQPAKDVQGLKDHLEPLAWDSASDPAVIGSADTAFTAYTDSGGYSVNYSNSNTITEVAVTDGTGTVTEQALCMLSGTGEFHVIDEYLKSRRNMDTLEEDAPGPSNDSKMTSLFSIAEEMSDDIIDAVDTYGDNRPYNITSADDVYALPPVGHIRNNQYTALNSETSAIAPLGLVEIAGTTDSDNYFEIEVHSIFEM